MSDSPFHASEEVPVSGGALHVARAGPPPADARAVVLAVHGITASHAAWRSVARTLVDDGAVCVLAPDLRGRGRSAELPPPQGIHTHAEDVLGVLDHAGVRRAVLAGHSMGAYVVACAAAAAPDRAAAVVLIDGGLPLPVPEDVDVDAALLAVRADGASIVRDPSIASAAGRIDAALTLVRAARGLLDEDQRPVIPQALREEFAAAHPAARVVDLPEHNHYTLVLGRAGGPGRVAELIAQAAAGGN